MDGLIHILAANSVAATLLALLAAAVGRWCRNPAMTHVLWLLVLVKLVTPPVVSVPLLNRFSDSPSPPQARIAQPLEVAYDAGFVWPETTEAMVPADLPVAPPISVHAEPEVEPRFYANATTWPWWLLAFSGLGTVLYIVTATRRAWCFSQLVRHGCEANGENTTLIVELSQKLRLRRVPPVVSVPARISPAVWPRLGGPVVLVPAELFARFDRQSRRALLAHELAHIRRRDHWVRLLEAAVTAACWWHPLAWIARGRLREAEEMCCDQWVLRICRGRAKQYATALVDTLDFLSGRSVALPALASGARPVGPLKRRIEMVMRTQDERRTAWPLRLAVLAAAVLLMSLSPAWADDDEPVANDISAEEVIVDISESIATDNIEQDLSVFAPESVNPAKNVIQGLVAQDITATPENSADTTRAEVFQVDPTDSIKYNSFFAGHGVSVQAEEPGGKSAKSLTITYDDGTKKEIQLPFHPKAGAVTISLNLEDGSVTAMNVRSGRTTAATSRDGEPARATYSRGRSETSGGRASSDIDPTQSAGTRTMRGRARVYQDLGEIHADASRNQDPAADSTEARLNRIEKVLEALQKQLQGSNDNDARPR